MRIFFVRTQNLKLSLYEMSTISVNHKLFMIFFLRICKNLFKIYVFHFLFTIYTNFVVIVYIILNKYMYINSI